MALALMGINLSAMTIFLGSLSMIACRRNCLNVLQKRFHKLKVTSSNGVTAYGTAYCVFGIP